MVVVSILHFSCTNNKHLMISNHNDLFDSLRLNVSINGREVFNRQVPLNLTIPNYIDKSIGRYRDSLTVNIILPEIGIKKSISVASKDFKYIYIVLTKRPDIEKIGSHPKSSQQSWDKKNYFKSDVSVSFTKKRISPLL